MPFNERSACFTSALSLASHHILASLVKGDVLSPEKIRATTGGIAFLPHPFRFSDTSVNNPSIVGSASHCNRSSPLHKGAKGDSALPTIPNPHYPSKIANTLASLVKGRWIDGKAQTVALLHFYLRYIRLFYSPNFLPSRRRDCFTPTNLSIPTTFSKAHQPLRPAPHSCHMNALLVSHHIASSAISAVASYNGFVWLTLSIHA